MPRLSMLLTLSGVFLGSATGAAAQQVTSLTPIEDLPRPGYEPRTIRIGSTILAPTVDASMMLDDNVFATPDDRRSDGVLRIRPELAIRKQTGVLDLRAVIHATLLRYLEESSENVTLFGGGIEGKANLSRTQSLQGRLRFDRSYERRSDPEAEFTRADEPSLINIAETGLDYKYAGPRAGFGISASVTGIDYLPAVDSDRDLLIYRGAVRGTARIARRTDVFVQGFAVRRDARRALDRNGIDRDTDTLGVLGGVSFDLTNRLQGEAGIGWFRSNPEGAGLRSFSGLALSSQLTWQPRARTAVTLSAFRGDVATVRIGAVGRIDTRLELAIDQEARHNLLLRGVVGLYNVNYRGVRDQGQRTRFGEVEASYLLDRHVRLTGRVNYTHRGADQRDDRFRRWQGLLGVRYAY